MPHVHPLHHYHSFQTLLNLHHHYSKIFLLHHLHLKRSISYQQKVDDEAVNAKIYDDNDPILVDALTKKFGNFTAVKDLKFSIK